MANQIRHYYHIGEDDISPFVKDYYSKIELIISKFDKKYKDLCMLAFVIAGENQIVSDLSNDMRKIVHEPIRKMFRDHMKDEVFHARFFSIVFEKIWPQLNAKEKEIMGLCFCDSMEILGSPRTDIYYFSLAKLGFNEQQISQYINDIYNTIEWKTTRISARMAPTISLLKSNNVFDIESVKNAFQRKNYII